MSGDYETLEINQPKISYFKKRSEDNTLWLDEMINKIETISCGGYFTELIDSIFFRGFMKRFNYYSPSMIK